VTAAGPTGDNEEVELKFVYADADAGEAIARWLDRRFPAADGAAWKTHEITDRYFDTPDSALEAAGYGARLRSVGAETVLTVKSDIEVAGGLHRRLELEAPATRALSPAAWPESDARARVIDLAAGTRRLIERFTVGQQRREREIALPGATAMASIDEAEIDFLGAPAGEIRQFEVELREGDPGALIAFARTFARARLARPEGHSKLAMAADLVEKAARVAPDDHWADAARKMLHRHVVRMLERESATRAGNVLALKQMRVATRRMRATWRVFDAAFSGAHAEHFDTGLRRVAGLLGAVRDLDVLLESIDGRDDLAPLAASWRARRDAGFVELVGHLDSPGYGRFIDELLEGTEARGEWSPGKRANELVIDRAPERLDKAVERLLAAAQHAQGSNEAVAWHALRIAAKKMRYSLEALRDVLDERAATDFIEQLRTLQDVLGEMNDASVAAREAAVWLTSTSGADASPADRVAVARYIGEREESVGEARTAFAQDWSDLRLGDVPPLVGVERKPS
jgi:CHAD domain-containing protein